jgi:hypothetical protein
MKQSTPFVLSQMNLRRLCIHCLFSQMNLKATLHICGCSPGCLIWHSGQAAMFRDRFLVYAEITVIIRAALHYAIL